MDNRDDFDRLVGRAVKGEDLRSTGRHLDAELLAAFVDGGLTSAQRETVEVHLADCPQCLQLTATMTAGEPAPASKPARNWAPWRLLAPLATAAVLVLAVIIWRQPQVQQQPSVFEVAEAPRQAASEPVLPSETSKQSVPDFRARENRSDQLAKREADARQKPSSEEKAAGHAAAAAATATAPPPAAAPPTTVPPPTTAAAAGETVVGQASSAPMAAVPPLPSSPPSAFRQEDALVAQRRVASASVVVRAPGDTGRAWRVTGITIETTADGGTTWRRQQSPVAVQLLAGASPAANVCWLVGRAGTVLLTTDGETWRPISLPQTAEDLVAVSATSGEAASVTTASGRTYRTADGGRTWTLQENPAAPF